MGEYREAKTIASNLQGQLHSGFGYPTLQDFHCGLKVVIETVEEYRRP